MEMPCKCHVTHCKFSECLFPEPQCIAQCHAQCDVCRSTVAESNIAQPTVVLCDATHAIDVHSGQMSCSGKGKQAEVKECAARFLKGF